MDGGYSQGGAPPTHMVGYFQGMPGYSIPGPVPSSSPTSNSSRASNAISIWAGDLDAYMDESFLRQAVTASGWGSEITRIKVVRDHYSGMHAGYGFLDAASPEAAHRVIATGSGMPIPGTNRCWRLNMGRNATLSSSSPAGTESNIYVGNLEPSVTDYQLMTAFRPRYASVRHAKVVCNEYGQSRGYGFVRFSNPLEANRAVSEMHGYVFNQKPIRLSPAAGRSRNVGTQSTVSLRGNVHSSYQRAVAHGLPTNKRPRQLMSPDDPNNTTIFIGGTASHITEDLLWQEFSAFGELEAVRVPVNKTGFAFVRFKNRDYAQRAKDEVSRTHFVSLNPNKPVRVEWATEQIPSERAPTTYANAGGMYGNSATGPLQYGNNGYLVQYNDEAIGRSANLRGFSGERLKDSRDAVSGSKERNGNTHSECLKGAVDEGKLDRREGLVEEEAKINASTDNEAGKGGGETEPPSKRVAVERTEYVGSCDSALNAEKDADEDAEAVKSENVADESPAMQFSWLNASSSQAVRSGQ